MRRLKFILLTGLVAALVPLGSARAQISDTDVKAAFLPRFARYVTWPPAAMPKGDDPYVLCVIGTDPFGGLLEQAARSQSIDGRRMTVRRMDSTAGSNGCQIAFVSGGRGESAGQALAQLGNRPVLTVTNSNQGGARGIIHFVVSGGRVRFYIDQAAAERKKMAISSRLLALAVGVHQ